MTTSSAAVMLVQESNGAVFAAVIAKLLLKGWRFQGSPYYNGDYHCQLLVNSLEIKLP